MSARICADLNYLLETLVTGAGAVIVADEAIRDADLRGLASFLHDQPAWSDIPFILLVQRGGGPERNPAAARIAEILGNVTFLERPFHPTTLASFVRTAIRSRKRQYEARSSIEALAEAENRLQMALKAGLLGSWTLDIDRGLINVSDAYLAHFGRRAADSFSYSDLLESVHPEDIDRRRAALQRTLDTGGDYKIEYRVIWPDRTIHWVEMRARGIRDSSGKVHQLVGVSSDITDRKTAEHEREKLLAALAGERAALADLSRSLERRVAESTSELMAAIAEREKAQEQLLQSQKLETIGKLTGGIAHDFNNLLLAVIGNLELLRSRSSFDPAMKALVDGALQGAERGTALTQRMLAFARQQDLRTTAVDLVKLVEGMHELLDRTLGPRVALKIVAAPALPLARVDANQVELAILNLAINARDAMPDGGSIDIAIEKKFAGAKRDLARANYLSIRVSDTGCGMDAATLSRAIDPFFSTKPLGKGTGLGLSMVHGLAVQLGGLLELSSEVGRGTSATLWLPVAGSEIETEQLPVLETAKSRAARILVVDDDALVRSSTVMLLEELGHEVTDADSGRRALEILGSGKQVDVVITDQAMPEMTGVELANVLNERYPTMPILLATGFADPSLEKNTKLPRLSKPYRLAQLETAVSRLLEPRS